MLNSQGKRSPGRPRRRRDY